MELVNKMCRLFREEQETDSRHINIPGKSVPTVLELHKRLTAHTKPRAVYSVTVTGSTINTIPQCIGHFVNLTALNFSHNRIEYIPCSIVLLKKLEVLDLSYNCLEIIPPIMCYFPSLTTLDLRNNRLERVPTDLLNLKKLNVIKLDGNMDLKSPSISVCIQGKDAIFEALNIRQSRSDAFLNWKPYYQGESRPLKTLVEMCIDCIMDSEMDYLSADIPPVVKTYLTKCETQQSSIVPLMKCSSCERYFTKRHLFDNHDCHRVKAAKK